MSSVPPFLIFLVGAALIPLTWGRLRQAVMLAVPILGGLNLLYLGEGGSWAIGLFDYGLELVRVDRLSLLFGGVFHLATLLAVIFALHVRDATQQTAALLYAGSTIGAVFAGDLVTLFVFWEMTVVTSVFLILARATPRAQAAAMRYLLVQVTAGVILLAGILSHIRATGDVTFGAIELDGLGSWLILLGFGFKAAFPLLHSWLTDAYPEATPTGTVFLSVFSTKMAIYALARGFTGTELLVYIGAVMTVFPVLYAIVEDDLRRLLSYSLIVQLGFMVCGIGVGSELALDGATAHAVTHILYKALLFMTMGAVLHQAGTVKASELGGLARSMPFTAGCCIIGAASISAAPLFSGFVSKALILTATAEAGYDMSWLMLLFASACALLYVGIRVPFLAFFGRDSGRRVPEAPLNMRIAMGLGAVLCVAIGVYPTGLYDLLPYEVHYHLYSAGHVLASLQMLGVSALAFAVLWLAGWYPLPGAGITLDAEWIYRRVLPWTAREFVALFAPLDRAVRRVALRVVRRFVVYIWRHHGPQGILAATLPAGNMVMWTLAVLAVVLVWVLYFL